MWKARDNRIDLVRGAEQEGPVDSEDADIGRNLLVLQDVHVAFLNVLCSNFGHSGGLRDLSDEYQNRQDHARFDGHGEVGKDREKECHQPGGDFEL